MTDPKPLRQPLKFPLLPPSPTRRSSTSAGVVNSPSASMAYCIPLPRSSRPTPSAIGTSEGRSIVARASARSPGSEELGVDPVADDVDVVALEHEREA